MLLKAAKQIWEWGCITTERSTRVKGWWLRMMLRRERTILVPLKSPCGVKVRCDREAQPWLCAGRYRVGGNGPVIEPKG